MICILSGVIHIDVALHDKSKDDNYYFYIQFIVLVYIDI